MHSHRRPLPWVKVVKSLTVVALAAALATLLSSVLQPGPAAQAPTGHGRHGSTSLGTDADGTGEGLLDVPPGGAAAGGDRKPFYDFVLAVFSGDDYLSLQKRDTLRSVYSSYAGWASVPDGNFVYKYSIMVLFVVGYAEASEDGDLVGDVLYVRCPRGYRNIVEKTKRMVSITKHMQFRYLVKADDDTFVCFDRLARYLHYLPEEAKSRVYAGIPTACGLDRIPMVGRLIKDPTHKWFDEKYVNHTLSGLDCYPVYMQGAMYVLAYPLVDFLEKGRRHLLAFTNEDVTVGTWLLGVDRVLVPFNSLHFARLWECSCSRTGFRLALDVMPFYHACKNIEQLKRCAANVKTVVC